MPSRCSADNNGANTEQGGNTDTDEDSENNNENEDNNNDNDNDNNNDGDNPSTPVPPPEEEHRHSYTAQTTEPTCTEDGYTLYTCGCGDSYKADFKKAGHVYTNTVIPPTCTKKGYTLYECKRCEYSRQDNFTDANGHAEVIDKAVAADCIHTGLTEGKHCSECGIIILAQQPTEKTEHTYNKYVCTVCGSFDPNAPDTSGMQFELTSDRTGYCLTGAGTGYGTNVKIPSLYYGKPVKTIGAEAFQFCSGIQNILMPDSITEIGADAFYNCSGLKSINIPESVKSMGKRAFSGCTSLTFLKLPSHMNTIDESAFADCSSLSEINIPDGIASIAKYLLNGCSSLKNLAIGKDVASIGEDAFRDCNSLERITVSEENTTYTSQDRIMYNKEQTKAVLVPKLISGTVTLPDTLWSTDSMFLNCTKLEGVIFPDAMNTIGQKAFSGCTSLKTFTIPQNVKTIGSEAFKNCTALQSIVIPDKVTLIENSAFSNCSALSEIIISDSVTDIGYSAFQNTAYYMNTENWENGTLYVGNHLVAAKEVTESFTVKQGTVSIAQQVFYNRKNLTSVTLPDSIKGLSWNSFGNCTALTKIIFGGSTETWKSITKKSYWNSGTGNYTIECTNGKLNKSENIIT